jgi:hypothetical protein
VKREQAADFRQFGGRGLGQADFHASFLRRSSFHLNENVRRTVWAQKSRREPRGSTAAI